jgi:hypothetical protein
VAVEIISAETVVPVEFKDAKQYKPSLWREFKGAIIRETVEAANTELIRGEPLRMDQDADTLNEGQPPSVKVKLQPGNSTLYEFKLRTKQSLLFTPSVYNLNFQIQYKMEDVINHDTVKYQLNVRSPLKALIWGSIAGSYVGTLLRSLHDGAQITFLPKNQFLVSLVSSALLGAVLVIAFARKKDVQPFISIEDFWGGFFVGFLAGYVGKSLLKQILPNE